MTIAVTAPLGASRCLVPDWLMARADADNLEVLITDARETACDRAGVTHIACPGDHVFALRRKAIAAARHDWVVVMEDHTSPMPDMVERLRAAIAVGAADVIAGGVENLTSTTPQSWAHFLYTAHRVWPASHSAPKAASISLLAVRKSALRADELDRDCGFEILALPRLSREGRTKSAPDARVDHVQEASLLGHCVAQYHNARCHSAYMRMLGRPRSKSIVAEAAFAVRAVLLSPLRVLYGVRGSAQCRLGHLPRFFALACFTAAGRLRGLWGGVGPSPYRLD